LNRWQRVVEFLGACRSLRCSCLTSEHLARALGPFRHWPIFRSPHNPPPLSLCFLLTLAAMLDTFEILTTSGVVLWSRTYVPVGANVINSLIRDVFIEERILPQLDDAGSKPTYKKEGYTLKWTASKDVGLIFVVCNPNQYTPRHFVNVSREHCALSHICAHSKTVAK
jgi:hypothetical protein